MGLNSDEGYSHRYHAGNVGDVWKHCVLVSALTALRETSHSLLVIETHAGHGRYDLGPTGEWTEGIGKLWATPPREPPEALRRYLELVAPPSTHRTRRYPGSPDLILALQRATDRAVFYDIDPAAAASLRSSIHRPRVDVYEADGLAALPDLLARAPESVDVLVHIDPPYGLKSDWHTVPDALIAAYQARPATRFLLWYPVKSYTRPNAMLQRLERARVP
ncbi:MAG: 23S rRNA (adenine(2030)-N(6))-methyltransferase RlmJ, partial [Myxococcota bacterium]